MWSTQHAKEQPVLFRLFTLNLQKLYSLGFILYDLYFNHKHCHKYVHLKPLLLWCTHVHSPTKKYSRVEKNYTYPCYSIILD